MRRLIAFATLGLTLLLWGCQEKTGPITATKPKELEDPELQISGVPAKALESGASFTITVSTKSEGDLTVTVNKPTVASVTDKGDKQYEVSAMSLQDVEVKLTVSQSQTKTYKSASAEATFQVKGMGEVEVPGPDDALNGMGRTFEEANGNVVSPERGMYTAHEVHSDSYYPVSAASVKAKLASGRSLWLLEFYLTEFMTSDISNEFLNRICENLDAIREGGAKAIVRFAYRDNNNNASEDKEPEVAQTLRHIAQIKPFLQEYEDVIFVLQAGFIGTWGEWYYTTHFNSLSARKELTDALLDALPSSRQIQLRTPAYKMKMYNLALKDTITAVTAHDGSVISRLAGHNDCFGADSNDSGTFDSETTRAYWKAETRYAIMGGETCKVSDYCLCPQTLQDLEDYHWTYLHDGYNQEVLSRWKTDGCFNEIESRMGYRLVLKDVHIDNVAAGKMSKVTIRLFNKGFAAPMNPRNAYLVWVTPEGKVEKSMLGSDPRTWQPGYTGIVAFFTPSTAKGTLYLELSDPLLPDNPAYSIVLANKDVFDAKTGYNKLYEVK